MSRPVWCLFALAVLWRATAGGGVQDEDTDDYRSCLDNFDVHTDKIIRTQDSRDMGAVYINERDVPTREDCLRLCCKTENCDVFVFEEKSPGSCYLFECGSPEDFKCKFTRHKNYTSAVLAVNRHMTDLESQIKFTQHEHELTRLRVPIEPVVQVEPKTVATTTSTELPINKEVVQLVPVSSNEHQKTNSCSRYQFSCHSSGECIAIYNACDGVPQCQDGSDEAPELGCPAQVSTTIQPKFVAETLTAPHHSNKLTVQSLERMASGGASSSEGHHSPLGGLHHQQTYEQPLKSLEQPQQLSNQQPLWSQQQQQYGRQHIDSLENGIGGFQNGVQSQDSAAVMPQSRASYGREGEGLAVPLPPQSLPQQSSNNNFGGGGGGYHSDQPTWPYQYTGGSQIFTHKGKGLVEQAEHQQHQYNIPSDSSALNIGQYGDQIPSDLSKYGYNDGVPPYRMFPQSGGTQMNGWQPASVHKPHGLQGGSIMDESMTNRNPDRDAHSGNGGVPPDYYYDESLYRNRGGQLPLHYHLQQQQFLQPAQHQLGQQQQPLRHPNQLTEVQNDEDQLVQPLTLPKMQQVRHKAIANSSERGVSKSEVSPNSHDASLSNRLPELTTVKPKSVDHHSHAHRKLEKLTAEVSLHETSLSLEDSAEIEGHSISPSGAILSLTFGLCITGIMVILVGCRMRMVQKRMRRGGKSPYAHDADFLVNGMYL